jgi:hypothetical protein
MQKPYIDVFYLSYTGIIQTKKFTKLRNYEKENNKIKDSSNQKNDLCDENSKNSENLQKANEENIRKYHLNKSKVRKRAIAFSRLPKSRKNFFFYTISFPTQLSDNHCFEVFNICMTRLRKDRTINDYLYVTERQKNSTLHFHILTNDWFSVRKMNNYVRSSLIFKLNRKEFEYDRAKIENYNGVDIAKNRTSKKVTNFAKQKNNRLIINYLTKYITKNNIEFYRLPFHSSHSISNLTSSVRVDQYEAKYIFSQFDSTNSNPKTIHGDFFSWYGFSNEVSEKAFESIDIENSNRYYLKQNIKLHLQN